eukprot:CAMPEP_0114239256 /NCGR_PEP_ID=MMETSP0058-20121206/8361_1 /TAXON_ID=36894 /ORGANISM="Pyramimonas parkeae, CCMP726" /LENGTH=395 /DNA_ID=CAMNT_0001351421 /DNA_START=142 /DNA_END=1330 /DNA_ORIENTATION=-
MTPSQSKTYAVGYFMLGLGSWLLVSCIFTEAAYLASVAPEGFKLFAHFDVCVQIGNVVPVVLVLGVPKWTLQHNTSLVIVYLRSPAGVVGNSSSVLFFPAAAKVGRTGEDVALAVGALSAGVGSCGIVANLLVLSQGLAVGGPNIRMYYSASVYFFIVACIHSMSLVAFSSLGKQRATSVVSETFEDSSVLHSSDAGTSALQVPLVLNTGDSICAPDAAIKKRALLKEVYLPLMAIFCTCFTEYAVPGLLPYLLPTRARTPSHLFGLTAGYLSSSILGRLASTCCANWQQLRRNFLLSTTVCGQSILFVCLLCIAHSPDKDAGVLDLWHTSLASTIAIITTFSFIHGYIITLAFQSVAVEARSTQWAGLLNQMGALAGSCLAFILVHYGFIPRAK